MLVERILVVNRVALDSNIELRDLTECFLNNSMTQKLSGLSYFNGEMQFNGKCWIES